MLTSSIRAISLASEFQSNLPRSGGEPNLSSHHQNDPGRTILEVILIIYAIRTLLQSRTKVPPGGGKYVQLTEKVRTTGVLVLSAYTHVINYNH